MNLLRLLLLTPILGLSLGGLRAADRPNVLYIFPDDHSARTIWCYMDTPDAYPWGV